MSNDISTDVQYIGSYPHPPPTNKILRVYYIGIPIHSFFFNEEEAIPPPPDKQNTPGILLLLLLFSSH